MPDLVSVVQNQDGRWQLLEPDGTLARKRDYANQVPAIKAARRINRARKGLPPDEEAFQQGRYRGERK